MTAGLVTGGAVGDTETLATVREPGRTFDRDGVGPAGIEPTTSTV